jgi:hypothetical protein
MTHVITVGAGMEALDFCYNTAREPVTVAPAQKSTDHTDDLSIQGSPAIIWCRMICGWHFQVMDRAILKDVSTTLHPPTGFIINRKHSSQAQQCQSHCLHTCLDGDTSVSRGSFHTVTTSMGCAGISLLGTCLFAKPSYLRFAVHA